MTAITQVCRITQKPFVITDKDQAFYERMGVPLPTLCPEERMRRRLVNRNERFLYHRKCDLTGKQIISSTSIDKPFPIYSIDAWWSDDWDPLSYGRDFDFSRPFFEQFWELKKQVPRLALQQQKPMENSEYCNCASRNKNCYLIFSTNYCEDCYYGSWINFCKDCVDNENAMQNELCYETVDCKSCYQVIYGEESFNCHDSAFIKNCIGCSYCLFCTSLNNKSYCIFNKQVTKEEYDEFRKNLDLGSYDVLQESIQKFEALKREMTVKFYYGVQNENVTGNYICNSRNCAGVYEVMDCEDVSYSNNLEIQAKDCMDHSYWGANSTQTYECQACGYDINFLRFCNLCWGGCSNLTYCDQSFSTQDSFGCISLKKKQYCILNKQYTKEEYEALMPRIIEHMKQTGEWGEFFPIQYASFTYNETLSNEWLPLTEEEAKTLGYPWLVDDRLEGYQGPVLEIPNHIAEVTEEITKHILTCEVTGKHYKVIPQELAFYKKMGLAVPHRSPDQRHYDRLKRRNPRKLWERNCAECSVAFQTTYAPERPEKVVCEACYHKLIY